MTPLSQQALYGCTKKRSGMFIHPFDTTRLGIHDDHACGQVQQQFALERFRFPNFLTSPILLRHIPEHKNRTHHNPRGIPDGRARVSDLQFRPVLGNEHGVVRQINVHPSFQHPLHRDLNRFSSLGIDDAEDGFQRLPDRLRIRPTRQRLRRAVEARHLAFMVASNDPVADGTQCRRKMLFTRHHFLPRLRHRFKQTVHISRQTRQFVIPLAEDRRGKVLCAGNLVQTSAQPLQLLQYQFSEQHKNTQKDENAGRSEQDRNENRGLDGLPMNIAGHANFDQHGRPTLEIRDKAKGV